jgi:hypothetical protein
VEFYNDQERIQRNPRGLGRASLLGRNPATGLPRALKIRTYQPAEAESLAPTDPEETSSDLRDKTEEATGQKGEE